jgi:glutamine amidotransferase
MQSLHERFAGARERPSWMELAPHLAELVAEVARHGNFNLLLSQGEVLFAHCSSNLYRLQRQHPFSGADLVDCDLSVDLSRVNSPEDCMQIVATEPLTRDEVWTPFRTGESVVLERGVLVWQHIHAGTRRFPPPASAPVQASAQYSTAG